MHTIRSMWIKRGRQEPFDAEALQLTYQNFPSRYRFVSKKKGWQLRKRGIGSTIGRMYFVSPRDQERYALRVLLSHVPGATSEAHLRYVNGFQHETCRQAAMAMGLLLDDGEAKACLAEAALFQTPAKLRELFVWLLVFDPPLAPAELWEEFKDAMTEDLLHAERRRRNDMNLQLTQVVVDRALRHIDDVLRSHNLTLSSIPGMPVPCTPDDEVQHEHGQSRIISEQLAYNKHAMHERLHEMLPKLTPKQREVFELFMVAASDSYNGGHGPYMFFLDSPGGSGKTFLWELILCAIRCGFHIDGRDDNDRVALAVASSGIASLLLDGGTTAHSRFKVPIPITAESMCTISAHSDLAKLIRMTRVILWDEASMQHKHVYEAVDRTIRDIMKVVDPALEHVPMGGKVVGMGGDFRQTLPIVPRGNAAAIADACLKRSHLWSDMAVHKLTDNMRALRLVQQGADPTAQQEWSKFLLDIGDGVTGEHIRLPDDICMESEDVNDLVQWVFGDLANDPSTRTKERLKGRAILTPLNANVDIVNDIATKLFPGFAHQYLSVDTVEEEEQAHMFPPEFLNSLNPQGMPGHCLVFKEGQVVMLLRNLCPRKGLANGTRLMIVACRQYVIQAEIVT
jgi:hypothetical protein